MNSASFIQEGEGTYAVVSIEKDMIGKLLDFHKILGEHGIVQKKSRFGQVLHLLRNKYKTQDQYERKGCKIAYEMTPEQMNIGMMVTATACEQTNQENLDLLHQVSQLGSRYIQ